MPNSGWPRSRNQTRLGQSGGVSRRHRRLSSLLGSSTTTAACGVAHVVEVGAEQRRRSCPALAADQQRAVLAVVGVDQPGAVLGAQHRQQRVGERAVAAGRRRVAVVRGGHGGCGELRGLAGSAGRRRGGWRPGRGVGAQDLGRHRDARDGDAGGPGRPSCARRAARAGARPRPRRRARAGRGAAAGWRREAAAVEVAAERASSGGAGGSRRGGPGRRRRAACRSRGVSAATTTSSQNRLRFWVRSALAISARLSVEVRPPSGRPQRSWRTSRFSWRR